jgi:solute carrier family 25 phosphate transporter 3
VSTLTAATTTSSTFLPYFMASVVAGAAASLVLCPMERTRIRLVTDPNFAAHGLFDGLQRIVQEEGISRVFSGLPAMLSKQVPYVSETTTTTTITWVVGA